MFGIGPMVGLIVFLSIALTIAVPVAVIWLLVTIARGAAQGPSTRRYDPAAEQLRYRFARGEISQPEFEEAMRALGYEKR